MSFFCRQIQPGITPNDVNVNNYLDLEAKINQYVMYPLKWRTRYRYHPGDTVIRKLVAAARTHFHDKLSLVGYAQDQTQYRIAVCATRPSGREGQVFRPVYQLEDNEDEWVDETELALHTCPHTTRMST